MLLGLPGELETIGNPWASDQPHQAELDDPTFEPNQWQSWDGNPAV